MRSTFIAILALCVLAPQTSADVEIDTNIERAPMDTRSNRQNLIGSWYLSQPTKKGGEWRVLSSLRDDGSYCMQFEELHEGRLIQKYSETGLWGISGNIHFTITRGGYIDGKPVAVSPERPGNYLAYKVLELSASTFVYESIVSGNRFQSRKVSEDFELPTIE